MPTGTAGLKRSHIRIYLFLLAICNLPGPLFLIHQRLVYGLNPFVGSVFLLIVLLILIPVLIRLVKWTGKNWFHNIRYEPPALFAVGLISWNVYMILMRNSTMEFHFHDTYYVISVIAVALSGSFFFGIFCIFYYSYLIVFKQELNIFYARIHFWISYWGLWYLFLSMRYDPTFFFLGEGSQPRRYVEYSGWADYKYLQHVNRSLFIVFLFVTAAQLLFLFNIISSRLSSRRSNL